MSFLDSSPRSLQKRRVLTTSSSLSLHNNRPYWVFPSPIIHKSLSQLLVNKYPSSYGLLNFSRAAIDFVEASPAVVSFGSTQSTVSPQHCTNPPLLAPSLNNMSNAQRKQAMNSALTPEINSRHTPILLALLLKQAHRLKSELSEYQIGRN